MKNFDLNNEVRKAQQMMDDTKRKIESVPVEQLKVLDELQREIINFPNEQRKFMNAAMQEVKEKQEQEAKALTEELIADFNFYGGDVMSDVLDYKNFAVIAECTSEQMQVALDFREAVIGDDLDALIALLSKEDIERLKGRYEGLQAQKDTSSWTDYLKSIHSNLKERYEPIKDDYNVTHSVRYTEHGEGVILFFEPGNEGNRGGETLLVWHITVIPEFVFTVVEGSPQYDVCYKIKVFNSLD